LFLLFLLFNSIFAEIQKQQPGNNWSNQYQQANANANENNRVKVNRKAQQTLPFIHDMSTEPIGGAGQPTGFGSMFGNNYHPSVPTFSVDPRMSMGAIPPSFNGLGMMPQMNSMIPPVASMSPIMNMNNPFLRNPNSVTHTADDDLSFYNSLSMSNFPELRIKKDCESIQRQAVDVANNLVKRLNKQIFKELMDYILKSKFLMGMTEVRLNQVLKGKFLSLMKKYTVLNVDNVKLINSPDDEMLDMELEDEEPFLDDGMKPQNKRKVDIVEDEESSESSHRHGNNVVGTPDLNGGASPFRKEPFVDSDLEDILDQLRRDNGSIKVTTDPISGTTIVTVPQKNGDKTIIIPGDENNNENYPQTNSNQPNSNPTQIPTPTPSPTLSPTQDPANTTPAKTTPDTVTPDTKTPPAPTEQKSWWQKLFSWRKRKMRFSKQ